MNAFQEILIEAPAIATGAGALPSPAAAFRLAPAASEKNDWLLWQLADSAFPTGGFAHSAGLEATWQHGEVRNRLELASFVEASLRHAGRSALPFVVAAHDSPERLREFDRMCDAFMTNHVANRASRLQGAAFLSSVRRIFSSPENVSSERPEVRFAAEISKPPFAHFAPVFGAVTCNLSVARETATRLFLFNHLRSLVAGAVRLNIIGPMEAQALQHRFTPAAEEIATRGGKLSLEDLAQTAPLLDLWQGAQDRLYSRLFQS